MAHPDLNELLSMLFNFAQDMLKKYGEFYPFGVSMDKQGKLACVSGYTGQEQLSSNEVIDVLEKGLSQSAKQGQIKAAGICINMRIQTSEQGPKTDAICARLEHENGEAVEVFLPYKKKLFKGFRYGEVMAKEGKKKIF